MSIEITEAQKHIIDFLNDKRSGVLATADQTGEPHAATIYFSFDSQEPAFYFISKRDTRKHHNLEVNARAALAVSDTKTQTTVQAEGTVSKVEDPLKAQEIFAKILQASEQESGTTVPPISKFEAGPYVALCLSPHSLRLANFKKSSPESFFEVY